MAQMGSHVSEIANFLPLQPGYRLTWATPPVQQPSPWALSSRLTGRAVIADFLAEAGKVTGTTEVTIDTCFCNFSLVANVFVA